jgi:Ca2+-binding RTX toxin-like protein
MDTRGNNLARSRKGRSGFTAVVGAIILLGLVAVIGSVALIWGNNFNFEKQKLSDYYVTNSNKIKERVIIEDVWLSTFPANTGVVSIRNVGDIGIKVSEVKINVLEINGGAACTTTCESGTSASNTVRAPFSPDSTAGLISSQQSLIVSVDKIDWDHANSKNLEVFITTDRGSIIWRVYDWRAQLAQVITCNGLPVTLLGTNGVDNINGTDYDDVIHTLGNPTGTDTAKGNNGNDVICGGSGQDFLEGGNGNDRIFGEDGNDQIHGELSGSPGSGSGGDDYLDGGAGTDNGNGGPHTTGDTCTLEIPSNCNP